VNDWNHRMKPVLSDQWIEQFFSGGLELPCDPDEAERLLLRIIEIVQTSIAHLRGSGG